MHSKFQRRSSLGTVFLVFCAFATTQITKRGFASDDVDRPGHLRKVGRGGVRGANHKHEHGHLPGSFLCGHGMDGIDEAKHMYRESPLLEYEREEGGGGRFHFAARSGVAAAKCYPAKIRIRYV